MGLFGKIFNKKEPQTVQIQIGGIDITVSNQQEAREYAERFLKDCKTLTKQINTTKNPRIFFEGYSELINITHNLCNLEYFVNFQGQSPTSTLSYLSTSKERETTFMLQRFVEDLQKQTDKLKTDKAKINTINKAFANLSKYDNAMTDKNIDFYKNNYNKLLNNI